MTINRPILELENLKVYYFTLRGVVRAVDDVSLKLNRGEILALVGESGCGKSTVGRSILRIIQSPGKIVGGRILFKGENILEKDEGYMQKIRGKHISMIFQEPIASLNPVLTVGEQIIETLTLHQSLSRSEAVEKAIELLRSMDMPDPSRILRCYPHELSGGMAQRVMIAIALSCNPDILIADEPTTALDVTIQAQILDLLLKLVRNLDTTTLLITHNFGIVAETSDRVAVMYAGKIVEVAQSDELFKNPLHPYTQALISAISVPDPELKRKKKRILLRGEVPSLINPPSGCRFHPRCPYMKEQCKKEEPKMVEIEKGHFVSCHLYGDRK